MKENQENTNESAVFSIMVERKITVGASPLLVGDGGLTGAPVNLPVPLFLISDYDSQYNNVITKLLPANGSVVYKSLTNTPDKKGLILTFTNPGHTIEETITIQLDVNDYVATLNATRTMYMLIEKSKVKLDDAQSSDQFNQPYYVIHKTGLTLLKQDVFKPYFYEPDVVPSSVIRDISTPIPIDNERGICFTMIPYSNGAYANGVSWVTSFICFAEDIKKVASHKPMGYA